MGKYELTGAEIANAPKIKLAGREFSVPKLGIRQNRQVVGALQYIIPVLNRAEVMAAAAKDAPDARIDVEGLAAVLTMSPDTFDRVADAVYYAVTRALPDFSREEFESMPIGVDELVAALPTVMVQSFALKKKKEAAPEATADPQ